MADRTTSVESPPGDSDTTELREALQQTQKELDHSNEEVLRLRDLLIGRDAELGATRGRLAELEDRSRHLLNVAARIQSGVPGVMRVGRAVRRRLRGRQV